MIVLTIKNKQQVALDHLIDQQEKVKGSPDKFLLDKTDFGLILVELNKIGKPNDDFTFGGDEPPDMMTIYRSKLTNKSINRTLTAWAKGKFTAKYKNIPLVFKAPKKKIIKDDSNDKW